MKENIEMSRSVFYIIVGLCAIIIMSTSLEAIIKAKDTGLFEMWLSNPKLNSELVGQTSEQLYSTYLTGCLSTFFVRVVTPMGLAIHSYLTLVKLRVNKLYVVIWTVLLVGSFIFSIIGESFYSVFFIISGICYLALVGVMIYLGKAIYNAVRL